MEDGVFVEFFEQLTRLDAVVQESNRRLIGEYVDPLFQEYLNVFVKSYLVSACSILEALIQTVAKQYVAIMRIRVQQANIPRNLVSWSLLGSDKVKDFRFDSFGVTVKDEEISDLISGNFHRTISAFKLVGVNLESDTEFSSFKDFIAATINKRNRIVHHNDDASDVSFSDIINLLHQFELYSKCIIRVVRACPHFSQ